MIVVYTPRITNRIKYSFRLILGNLLGLQYRITDNRDDFLAAEDYRFTYGREEIDGIVHFSAVELLFQKGISGQSPAIGYHQEVPYLFPVFHSRQILPFDPFAAAFYMVSRYEEYLPFRKDPYGRFRAEDSLAFQKGFLTKPVVNLWANIIAEKLQGYWPAIEFVKPVYRYVPTIDVDQAYSYLHKGMLRTLGGYVSSIVKRDFSGLKNRTNVLLRRKPDPFYTFESILDIHRKYNLSPIFFILFGSYGSYDKNIPVYNQSFVRLINQLADEATVGIHPSYASNADFNILKKEVRQLSDVLHTPVTLSRQHFLKIDFPQTFRNLMQLDITHDYSLGFAGHYGFRAGISTPFMFYDLDLEEESTLTLVPLCMMDGTLKDYMGLNEKKILEVAGQIIQSIKDTGGTFVTLMHNDTFDDSGQWKDWSGLYEKIVQMAL
ncbi:MAG: polysaccharide deacetylase family protein [Bacteroidales bacterium]|nr:polysaccharide deacetylase family protein [Bacteroidales bacterium]